MIKKRRYLDYEILKAEKEGYKLFCEGRGSVSFDKRSTLFRSFVACQNLSADVIFVIGGGRRDVREKDWAVMYRPLPPSVEEGRTAIFEENRVVSGLFEKEDVFTTGRPSMTAHDENIEGGGGD